MPFQYAHIGLAASSNIVAPQAVLSCPLIPPSVNLRTSVSQPGATSGVHLPFFIGLVFYAFEVSSFPFSIFLVFCSLFITISHKRLKAILVNVFPVALDTTLFISLA